MKRIDTTMSLGVRQRLSIIDSSNRSYFNLTVYVSDTYRGAISVRYGVVRLIGRTHEIKQIQKAFHSSEAEFIVLYGRRRIGKTYLIREYFSKQPCDFFQATGLQNGNLNKQLIHFAGSLSDTYTQGIPINPPVSWEDAFRMLTQFIEVSKKNKKTVIFLDELPWIATRRSGLLEALDYYWNYYWSSDPSIVLIGNRSVCSNQDSVMTHKVVLTEVFFKLIN